MIIKSAIRLLSTHTCIYRTINQLINLTHLIIIIIYNRRVRGNLCATTILYMRTLFCYNNENNIFKQVSNLTNYYYYITHEMVNNNNSSNKKKKVKRLSSTRYYPTAYISNPCDQLFGPPLEVANNSYINNNNNSNNDNEIHNNQDTSLVSQTTNNDLSLNDNYIPAPKWTKIQNGLLEDFFKKSRYPKQTDLKLFAQKLSVMDSDVDEWFRKRRGKDRKTRRKNEALKNLMDKYIDK
jgi:hypothetical protein